MADPNVRDFEALVVRYQDVVCAVAYSVLRDRARSEDVAQDAFLVAWQKLPTMSPPPVMPGWLCGIAKNLARNVARRRKETAMETEPMTASTSTPLVDLLDHEAAALAERALARLSPPDREVVVLYYRGDGTVGAVADALGISEPAARQRLHRGRERLKSAVAAVEATVRATRPGPAFTAACVATYLATGGTASADTHAAATTARAATLGRTAALVLAGAVVVVGMWTLRHVTTGVAAPPATTTPAAGDDWMTPVRTMSAAQRGALLEKLRIARTERFARIAPPPDPAGSGAAPVADKIKVYDFAGGRLDAPPPPSPTEPRKPGPLTKSDMRRGIFSVQPLVLECYQAAVDRLPRADGTLAVVIRFSGEPGVSTLVESARLEGDAHFAADAELAECIDETLMTIELPPMDEGGLIDIHYPFVVGPPAAP